MKKERKRVIIIMGPPGSGKGTQAQLLAEKLSFYYFETSKIGEERIKKAKKGEYIEAEGKKYYFTQQEKLWLTGKLWDPPFVARLVKDKIKELFGEGKSPILAGSPRTLYEGKKIVPLLKKLYGTENIDVLFLEIKAEESIWRNSHRKICQLMRHSILYNKETKSLKVCPLDGSKLVRRKGLDDPKTIKTRLKEYQERTFPLIQYFKEQGLKVKKINGSLPPADVFRLVLKALKITEN